MTIMIERKLATAPYWMPVERDWVDAGEEIRIVESPTPAALRQHEGIVLVDTLLASTVAASSLFVAGHGVSARSISLLTMVTSDRPDSIESVTASAPGISLTGRAVAEVVIPEFYGIQIANWTDQPDTARPDTLLITENENALLPTGTETDFHEDLGRAWYLLTDTPFVSHVCLVGESIFQNDPAIVRQSVRTLDSILAAANEQRRLLRRNVSRDHDIDRDLVVDVFDGLEYGLSSAGRDGIQLLFGRVGVLDRIGSLQDRFVDVNR